MVSPKLRVSKLFDDPTPNGILNQRLHLNVMRLMDFTDLNDEEKQQIFYILLLVCKKLAAVWGHYQDYIKIEDELIASAKEKPIRKEDAVIYLDYPQALFFEFDEFLTQLKSSLDYVVKILTPILGRKVWNIYTFGSKGKDVVKALSNNLPKKYRNNSKGIIHTINLHEVWLDDTINARDKINHFLDGGINFEHFAVYSFIENGKEHLKVPMYSNDQDIRTFMNTVWQNLFMLCEDFISFSVAFRLKKEFAFFKGKSFINSAQSPWKVLSKEEYEKITSVKGWKDLS